MDDLFILTIKYLKYHVNKLESTLNKMNQVVLKFNIERSFFRQSKMEYLGLWVTCDGLESII